MCEIPAFKTLNRIVMTSVNFKYSIHVYQVTAASVSKKLSLTQSNIFTLRQLMTGCTSLVTQNCGLRAAYYDRSTFR